MAVLLWEGKSELTGDTIGVLATLDSDNVKTGRSVQIWILNKSVAPHIAQKTGADESVCGACPNRPKLGGDCYVVTFQGPNAVWRQWKEGRLQKATIEQIRGIAKQHGLLRLGAYGDPSLIPFDLLEKLCDGLPVTGYTHQWHLERVKPYAKYLMASCDNESDVVYARACGFRTFRVVKPGQVEKLAGEISCPASVEAGNKLQCRQCKACGGHSRNMKSNIVIKIH